MPCNTPPPPYVDIEDDVEEDPNMDGYEVIEIDDELMEEDMLDSLQVFSKHTDSVFCCIFNKTATLAVSGGQDEKAYVWCTATGETKFECSGFADSVIAADFNHDSSLVVVGGMDGKVFVWDVDSGNKVWSEDVAEITWIKWHPAENILFAGTVDGSCWKWDIPGNENTGVFPTSGPGTACGELLEGGAKCVVGYMDGSIKIWDTIDCTVVGTISGREAHAKNVISIACSSDSNLIATGSEDGTAKLIRSSNSKVLHTFNCNSIPAASDDKECVENVAFCKSHPYLVTGTNAGNLRVFDVSTHSLRVAVDVNSPIVKLICQEDMPNVYVTVNGDVELYSATSGELVKRFECHNVPILDFAISQGHQRLLTASDDFTCKLFDMNINLPV